MEEKQAEIYKLKESLEITQKEDVIENVIKRFNADDIYEINKYFKVIKEGFLKVYGSNNPNLTTADIVDEIKSIIERINNPFENYEIKAETYTLPATGEKVKLHIVKRLDGSNSVFEIATDNNSLYINNTATGNHVYLKIGKNKNKNIIFYSKTINDKGNFKGVKDKQGNKDDRWVSMIYDYLKLDKEIASIILKGAKTHTDIYDVLLKEYELEPISDIKTEKIGSHLMLGWGLKHPEEEVTKYAHFGNCIILLNKLFL
jgi:hypothetical protein